MKRAAITGHTTGLGNSWYRLLAEHNYEVHGFSRTTGYDLRDYLQVSNMLEKIKDFDLFINNAKPDYSQSQILYRLVRSWVRGGTVVSISSQAVKRNPGWTDTFLLEYLTQKVALDHAHQVLESVSPCSLILLHPAHLTDTDNYVSQSIKDLNL